MTIDVSVNVSKESYEHGQGVVGFLMALRQALQDGWQTGQDIPILVTAALTNLVPAMQGADQIALETKEDIDAFLKAWLLTAEEAVVLFLKK
jgi:hypothetical protein